MIYKPKMFRALLSTLVLLLVISINHIALAETFSVSNSQELRQALLDAAGNGQSDIITLADGTYRTTDDGKGTFSILDSENYELTIQGSSAENVVLSGENIHQVLSLFGVINTHLFNISLIKGNSSSDGGGVFAQENLDIKNCIIVDNTTGDGGGGFYAKDVTVKNTIISRNTATTWGGGFEATHVIVADTLISDNTASGYWGGGGIKSLVPTITNSIISGNTATRGSAISTGTGGIITNSIIVNNHGNGLYAMFSDGDFDLLNSVFISNEYFLIDGPVGVLATISNCYIDETKINVPAFKNDNIFGGDLDFADQANDDFHIGENSVLIDAGTTTVAGVDFPSTDMDGNLRVVGTAIDIGPYEVSTTRPTISSFLVAGNLTTGQELTFTTVATAENGRTIDLFEIDFGDGNYVAASAAAHYTFYDADTYAVTVRVTDSAGEFSTKTINITITPDPTLADLITEAITRNAPEDVTSAILGILQSGLTQEQQAQIISEAIIITVTNERLRWDSKNDGKIGLAEAIRALQVTSGL